MPDVSASGPLGALATKFLLRRRPAAIPPAVTTNRDRIVDWLDIDVALCKQESARAPCTSPDHRALPAQCASHSASPVNLLN